MRILIIHIRHLDLRFGYQNYAYFVLNNVHSVLFQCYTRLTVKDTCVTVVLLCRRKSLIPEISICSITD